MEQIEHERNKKNMDKLKNNITGTIIATIIALITIVGFSSSFISNQAKLEVQLSNIQERLVTIDEKLDNRDTEIKNLTERIIILEQEMKEK